MAVNFAGVVMAHSTHQPELPIQDEPERMTSNHTGKESWRRAAERPLHPQPGSSKEPLNSRVAEGG